MANAFEIAMLGPATAARVDSIGLRSVRNEQAAVRIQLPGHGTRRALPATAPAIELMRTSAPSSGACRTGDATLE